MIYYVSQKNTNAGDGSMENPFRTIAQAASAAQAGDTVLIGEGIYREQVSPRFGGLDEQQRITYRNAEGASPVISGAEILSGWTRTEDGLWTAQVNNALFGSYNPYTDSIFGDWYDPMGQVHHTGDVFLDGTALYETASREELLQKDTRPERLYRWFSVTDAETTTFFCDFDTVDPREHTTEISVRPTCFFPEQEGLNYITVSGLTLCHAAAQWAPPTAFQPAIIGPNWSRGWIIENCTIYGSKCCGISLGKKRDPKDNAWSKNPSKDGMQTYTEMIFSMLGRGWNREYVGGHTIRNNEIYDCGQTGIVGCMGGAFSTIVHNHIHHINIRGEFGGAEIAGIKLHAAIDCVIADNIINDTTRALWLDWEAQGAEVSRNAFFHSHDQDLFIEVCHGPCLVENNLLLSGRSLLNVSEGTAFVHNLFAGSLYVTPDLNRFTLYHQRHSTAMGGVMLVFGGDDRVISNIFLGKDENCGTEPYEKYCTPTSAAHADLGHSLPISLRDNLYLNGTNACSAEKQAHTDCDAAVYADVIEENGHFWLHTNLGSIPAVRSAQVTTDELGHAFQSEQSFEHRDGSPLQIDTDFFGSARPEQAAAGPFESCPERILLV